VAKSKKHSLRLSPKSHSPQENIWLALRASKQKAARWGDNSEKSLFLARFYNRARTYFNLKV
jgi:hypothetical protein